MAFILARVLLVAAISWVAALVQPLPQGVLANAAFGAVIAALVVLAEFRLRAVPIKGLLGAVIGGLVGLLVGRSLTSAFLWTTGLGAGPAAFANAVLVLGFLYTGATVGVRYADWLHPMRLRALFQATGPQRRYKILDTSVIIDGRIADVCETGFLDGTLVVPQFVLKELQLVADSADSMKRNRGRRGPTSSRKSRRWPAWRSSSRMPTTPRCARSISS